MRIDRWRLTLTYHFDMSYLFLVANNPSRGIACASLKTCAVRTLHAQMLESEGKATCDGMDGAATSTKSAAFVA